MRFNKRASLEIGINTIVILVIAMTLLGLGVVFVRNLFTKMGSTVDIIEPGDISSPPTADRPIKLVPSTVELKAGKTKDVQVLVYNKAVTGDFTLSFGKCTGLDDGKTPYLEAIPGVTIEQGDFKGFKTLVYAKLDDGGQPGENLAPRRYICQLKASDDANVDVVYAEQFIMEVTA